MFDRLASESSPYVVGDAPRVIAAADGNFAAVLERRRIVIVELAAVSVVGELASGPNDDVAWIGTPARLLRLARGDAFQTATLIDPAELRAVAEARVEATSRMLAVAGHHGLLVGARGATVLAARSTQLAQFQFPARALPTAAGAAARQFVVALGGSIEQWDPEQRVPKLRLRLRQPHGAITALGGSDRVVWLTSQDDPARIECIALVNRGQPAAHQLPEPIASVVAHPQRDVIACVGTQTGTLYVVDLEAHAPRVLRIDGRDRVDSVAFAGRGTKLICATTNHPLALVDLDGRGLAHRSAMPHPANHDEPAEPPTASSLRDPAEHATEIATGSVVDATIDRAATLVPTHADPATSSPTEARVAVPASALASLGRRSSAERCTASAYQDLLEHHRRAVSALAVLAIARDWDAGRIAFSDRERAPFESEVLGLAGRLSGLMPAQVAAAVQAHAEARDALASATAALAGQSPLEALCAEHDVGPAGELVLLHVAAPAIWGELARLYGILTNDPQRAQCDEHLLWQLLRDRLSRREVARELDRDAPLVRAGLVRVGDRARPFQSLVADPIAVAVLAGANLEDVSEHGIEPVPATVALDRLALPRAVIERALADLAAAPAGAGRLVVRGRTGSGRRTLLATLAELAGRTLATIDAAMLLRDKRLAQLPALLQHANIRGWLPCVDGLDTIASEDSATRGAVRDLLRDYAGPIAVRLAQLVHPPLDPGYVLIDLPTSSTAERAEQWTRALAERGLAVHDADALAARFTVGPGTIDRIRDAVAGGPAELPGRDRTSFGAGGPAELPARDRTSFGAGGPAELPARDRTSFGFGARHSGEPISGVEHAIDEAMRQYLETRLGAVATRVTRLATWAQVVLPSDVHDSIVELIARVRHRRTVYDTWGFDRVMTTSRGLTALFEGGPGTGKTLVAGAIASELGLDLYRIDLSRVMSKWIGETEQNLAKVFDAAEEGQAVILFDEADSLFTKRTEVRSSVDRYANIEVNYLLQRLDSFEGVAILTTNHGAAIDAAFKRRLSCRLTFPFPDEEARERLWRVHLPDRAPRAGELDLEQLAQRYKMSGGYIRNAVLRAAFLAAEERSPLTHEHLERAVRAEFREGGKLADSGVLE